MSTLSVVSGYFCVNQYKAYANSNGILDEQYLSIVGSVASFCSAIRFVWSLGTDYFSYKLVYAVLLVIQIIVNFTI